MYVKIVAAANKYNYDDIELMCNIICYICANTDILKIVDISSYIKLLSKEFQKENLFIKKIKNFVNE